MINFLHTFNPEPILISLGPLNIYWYGVFIILGVLAASLVVLKLAESYKISKSLVIDSIFYLVLFGIIGARLYHVFLELPFYVKNPLNIFMLWRGGLAIHGGIIAGLITGYYFARKHKLDFWQLAAIYAPALALAQAIGRWGNYFNQEIFGRPTDLPWGIPIATANRIPEFFNGQFFHPVFLYESTGNLLIFLALIYFHVWIIKKFDINKIKFIGYKLLTLGYLLLYSALRFLMEFIRIDSTPEYLGLRLPQIVSLLIILLSVLYGYKILKNTPHASALDIN